MKGPKVWVEFRGEPDLGAAQVVEANIANQISWSDQQPFEIVTNCSSPPSNCI